MISPLTGASIRSLGSATAKPFASRGGPTGAEMGTGPGADGIGSDASAPDDGSLTPASPSARGIPTVSGGDSSEGDSSEGDSSEGDADTSALGEFARSPAAADAISG